MKIGGLQKLTLVDYPGKVAATVFLIGCNFRCGFCQNLDIVDPERAERVEGQISESDFFKFLDSKIGLIDGICITGGEPTINADLEDFIKKIKVKEFLIKLDSNGSNPEMLERLIREKLLDFIAMDVKTSPEKYKEAIGEKIHPIKSREAGSPEATFNRVKQSVDLIKNSGIDYEFRTTVVPGLVEKDDIEKIGQWLQGAKKIALQQFQNKKVLDKEFEKVLPYPDETLKKFKKILEKYIERVELRA
ncbi:MAG TPA: anaerobic ribonucleoside-triphosphate reductase activating protein [Candidatus Paceibacterota bacterium]|nr:anaerobic ribonucleoside-triphosphate reductase activating protein [Candidatus Paceibacterota bacterium]